MKRRFLAMTMAAVTALTSTSICAFADGQDSEALAAAITIAKTRLDIPEELTEFTYSTENSNLKDTYSLTWRTPDDAVEYQSVSVTVCGSLITQYYSTNDWGIYGCSLAKLTGDELFSKAKQLIKQINPTVSSVIDLDRDSLNISLCSDRATISFVRTKNGVPVQNDRGTLTLNKNTGELISFYMNWHEKASFKSATDALSEAKAKEKYAEMINLQPQYEIYYDWESNQTKARLVYCQTDYGEINAFTGKKSNFESDGYYDTNGAVDDTIEMEESASEADKGSGYDFTEQELAEINKDLPYAGEAAVIKLLQDDPYLTYKTDMELVYSNLHKLTVGNDTKYYYTANFTNDSWGNEIEEPVPLYDDYDVYFEKDYTEISKPYQSVCISLDAETGQILNYSYYDSSVEDTTTYDLAKADKLAEDIAKKYAGDRFTEFVDDGEGSPLYWEMNNIKHYTGSSHSWTRYANDIKVSGNEISVDFNADMKLSSFYIDYTDIALPDPAGMLTADQVMAKFWQTNDLDLYYLARLNNKVTKTVLVYGAGTTIYADAFTGEQIYNYYIREKNDLSGIKDKEIKKMAQQLNDHGIIISTEKFSENDPATAEKLQNLLGYYSDDDSTNALTKGNVLVMYVKSVCGDEIPALKGIYKSPFSDVSNDDENVGYYAIAYGLGVVSGDKLNADSAFTMGDMIKFVYSTYTGDIAM
ncbi:MAG: YcdB/YcdC domain-containing protein [Oscillospiraceae bacterium]